jgi:hypothetical protein
VVKRFDFEKREWVKVVGSEIPEGVIRDGMEEPDRSVE